MNGRKRPPPKSEAVAGFGTLVRAGLQTVAAVPLGVAALFIGHFTHWILALPVAGVALWLLVKARPRLVQEWREMDRRSARTVAVLATSEDRERCPCCRAPTLAPDRDTCVICDWSNEIILGSGKRLNRKNAVDNFRRYGSVYPPADRPEWCSGSPSKRELALRQELTRVYAAIDAGRTSGWFRARRLERQLADLEHRRISAS
jgi:hypothetical protein